MLPRRPTQPQFARATAARERSVTLA
jgi:hypothetical protein